jgi:hypothetical protein
MPQKEWSSAENWVWEQICAGKIADFHERLGKLAPSTPEGWANDRQISRILTRDRLRPDLT